MPDSLKTKISAAITTFVKNPAMIADPELRARCQAMLDGFNALVAAVPPRVFVGGSDTPQSDPTAHYGAYSPTTHNIHFDPWALQNLNSGSDKGWQIANTALHETAHVMGYEHAGALIVPYRGRTPVYASDELYFKDLNPGAGCMKP
ncbi:MAG: hypothetical protein JWL61_2328 [Gemmatimonadetes bacterium]|nr:hypothetical protein [Gemmatimonadota bacterium]